MNYKRNQETSKKLREAWRGGTMRSAPSLEERFLEKLFPGRGKALDAAWIVIFGLLVAFPGAFWVWAYMPRDYSSKIALLAFGTGIFIVGVGVYQAAIGRNTKLEQASVKYMDDPKHLETLLQNLDQRLAEGNITEATWRQLRFEYEAKLKKSAAPPTANAEVTTAPTQVENDQTLQSESETTDLEQATAPKNGFTVMLKEIDPNKINIIKTVRELTPLGLKEAKDLVEAVPTSVLSNVSKSTAERAKAALESLGARIEVVSISEKRVAD